ncbi:MAG: SEC-C motif-containing protein [Limisphaerales bacterium]|jgi:SEC-C motif-containing protein
MATSGTYSTAPCPCESGFSFAECCEKILLDPRAALTPSALMRSRYTAYVIGDDAHLLNTWHQRTRPGNIEFVADQKWLGLKIKRAEGNTVEFVARFKIHGKGHRLHETSRFEQIADHWYYVDGDIQ